MEITRVLLSCVLIAVLCTDVIISRATRSHGITHMEAMIKDIDDRLIASEKSKSRRRKRNVMTHKFAIMEFCLQNPGACRRELARLRRERQGGRRRPVVIVIEK